MTQLGLWTRGLFNLTTTITVISPAVSINKQQSIIKNLYELFGDIKCIILNNSSPTQCRWIILIEDVLDQAKLCSLFSIKGEEDTEKIVYFPTSFSRKQIEANGTGTPMVFNFNTDIKWIGLSIFADPIGVIWKNNNGFRLIWRMDLNDLVRYMPVNMTGMNENLSIWTEGLFGLKTQIFLEASPGALVYKRNSFNSYSGLLREFGTILDTKEVINGWWVLMDGIVTGRDIWHHLKDRPKGSREKITFEGTVIMHIYSIDNNIVDTVWSNIIGIRRWN